MLPRYKPVRANRCARYGLVYDHNIFGVHADGKKDGRTYGRADPQIEVRGGIFLSFFLFSFILSFFLSFFLSFPLLSFSFFSFSFFFPFSPSGSTLIKVSGSGSLMTFMQWALSSEMRHSHRQLELRKILKFECIADFVNGRESWLTCHPLSPSFHTFVKP